MSKNPGEQATKADDSTRDVRASPPPQTPLYHSLHKARYARQEQIRQIQEVTQRQLLVYFSNTADSGARIDQNDIPPFGDLLYGLEDDDIDLLIQSSGGDIDKAEKIVYMCRSKANSFRVIVPESAKSAATLIALAADSILMGYTSELGPIDPQVTQTTPGGRVFSRPALSFLDGLRYIVDEVKKAGELSPAYYPLLEHLDPALIDFCEKAIERSKNFAIKWLSNHMCKGQKKKAEGIAEQLLNVERYQSHGIVIDAEEATELGLCVERLDETTPELWDRIWRLYCDYEVNARGTSTVKVFESDKVSITMA